MHPHGHPCPFEPTHLPDRRVSPKDIHTSSDEMSPLTSFFLRLMSEANRESRFIARRRQAAAGRGLDVAGCGLSVAGPTRGTTRRDRGANDRGQRRCWRRLGWLPRSLTCRGWPARRSGRHTWRSRQTWRRRVYPIDFDPSLLVGLVASMLHADAAAPAAGVSPLPPPAPMHWLLPQTPLPPPSPAH